MTRDANTGWNECSLGDVVTLKRGYDLPKRLREPGDVPIVSSSGITGYHNVGKVEGPGVVTGRCGTLGEVFFIEGSFWPLNTSLYVHDFKGNSPRFVSYLLRTVGIETQNVASAVPGANRNVLHMLPVRVPSVPIQREIALILSAYDDLIENNTRRIEILEEMARAVYREWFVEFRFPGHERVGMVDSELGPIPEGWIVKSLFDVAEVTYGHPFKSKLFNETGKGTGVVRIRDVKSGRPSAFTTEDPREHYLLQVEDVIVGMDGQFHIGKWWGKPAYLNQRVARFRPLECLSSAFLFEAVKPPIKTLEATVTGTTVAHLLDRDLRQVRILVADDHTTKAALSILDLLFDLGLTLRRQNETLRLARDLLLPRLVSGEIDVSEAAEGSVVSV